MIEGIVSFTIFLMFIGLLILTKRLSAVKDEIMLRQEYIYIASFGSIFGIIEGILYVSTHNWNKPDPVEIEVLQDALYLILPSPFFYGLILIQTQWVLYQYNQLIIKQKKKLQNDDSNDLNKDNIVTLKDIMSDFEGYKVLMEYLIKCVSAENLLYISEVIQFMRDITKKYGISASSVQLQHYFDQYNIPKILPKSSIMTSIDATSIRFLRLCEKYILEQSEFEINISHKNRKSLIKLYKILEIKIDEMNPKISKLANIFGDDAQFAASRRASSTLSQRIKSTSSKNVSYEEEKEQKRGTNNKHTKSQNSVSHKVNHSCIEDFQLLSNDELIIQQIYDNLCQTLGDVYTNLNDGFIRFMQTDVYFRWYSNIKKDKILKEEDEGDQNDDDDDEDEEDEIAHNKNVSLVIVQQPIESTDQYK